MTQAVLCNWLMSPHVGFCWDMAAAAVAADDFVCCEFVTVAGACSSTLVYSTPRQSQKHTAISLYHHRRTVLSWIGLLGHKQQHPVFQDITKQLCFVLGSYVSSLQQQFQVLLLHTSILQLVSRSVLGADIACAHD